MPRNAFARLLPAVSAATLLAVAIVTGTAAAAPNTITVTYGGDGADANPGDGICEITAGLGDCSLRAALMEGQTVPGPLTVDIDPSIPSYQLSVPGVAEDAGATGDLDITGDVTISGTWTPNFGGGFPVTVPLIDVSTLGDRVLDVAPGATLTLRAVAFDGSAGDPGADGGAVRNAGTFRFDQTGMPVDHKWMPFYGGTATRGGTIYNAPGAQIVHVAPADTVLQLRGGNASVAGGNLYNAGTVSISADGFGGPRPGAVSFEDGSAPEGGAIYNSTGASLTLGCGAMARFGVATAGSGGTLANYGTATLLGASLDQGQATAEGGNLHNGSGAGITTDVCSTDPNSSTTIARGAAPIGANVSNRGRLDIAGLTLVPQGTASFSGGGLTNNGDVAIGAAGVIDLPYNAAPFASALALESGTWSMAAGSRAYIGANTATAGAGALQVNGGVNQLTRTHIAENTVAGDGVVVVAGGLLDLSDSSIAGNHSSGGGAGLTVTGGIATVTNTTIANNASGAGLGLFRPLGGSATLSYVTVAADGETAISSPTGPAATIASSLVIGACALPNGALTSLGDNVMSSGGCPAGASDLVSAQAGLVGPPTYEDGAKTLRVAPLAGNPAIDHVRVATSCPATDQMGRARPSDGDGDGNARCDAGAYEASDVASVTTAIHVTVKSALTGVAPSESLCLAAFTPTGDVAGEDTSTTGTLHAAVVAGDYVAVVYPCDAAGDIDPSSAHQGEWYRDLPLNTSNPFPWPATTTVLSVTATTNLDVCLNGASQKADEPGLCKPPVTTTVPPPTTVAPTPTTPTTAAPTVPAGGGTITGTVGGTGGVTVCVAAVAPASTQRSAWAFVRADGTFELKVPDGEFAVVAYRCSPTSGDPIDKTTAVWSGDIPVSSSTLFRPPSRAVTVRPGTSIGGTSTLRLDLSSTTRSPSQLAFTGASSANLAFAGLVLVGLGGAALARRRRHSC